jgi:hypothetical protein
VLKGPTWFAKLRVVIVESAELELECVAELHEVRRSMIEDFQINPLLVRECSHEIAYSCDTRLRGSGRTVHCLMDLARPQIGAKTGDNQPKISDKCLRAVSSLFL